jgi:hypothetical protein
MQLMPGERRTDLRFHLLDARNKARMRMASMLAEAA